MGNRPQTIGGIGPISNLRIGQKIRPLRGEEKFVMDLFFDCNLGRVEISDLSPNEF
jgi:hypothetical protein